MEILGAGSAVVTIAVEFAHISRRLRRCIRSLTYARRDIKVIHDEVEAFSTLLGLFHSTVTDDRLADEGLSTKIKTSKMTQHIVISGRAALDKIKQILLEVDPLRTDKGYPAHKRWIARWKWSGRKEEWIPVQIELNSIKLSADLLISIVFCQHLVHKLDQLRAEQKNIPNELLQQLSLYTSQVKTLGSRCRKAVKESRRVQSQQAHMLQIGQEILALASRLARSHIASHPELEAVLDHDGVPSFASGNSITSRNSGSTASPPARSSSGNTPRGPRSGPSSGHVPIPEISSDATDRAPVTGIPANPSALPSVAEIPNPGQRGSAIPSDQAPASGRSSMDSELLASEVPLPRPMPAGAVPTALFGPPEPNTRPANPRRSDADLAERPVIVDDDRGLREEFRRPRRLSGSSHTS